MTDREEETISPRLRLSSPARNDASRLPACAPMPGSRSGCVWAAAADLGEFGRVRRAHHETKGRRPALRPGGDTIRDREIERLSAGVRVQRQVLQVSRAGVARLADDDHAPLAAREEGRQRVFAEIGVDGDGVEAPGVEVSGSIRLGGAADVADFGVEDDRNVRGNEAPCLFQGGEPAAP